MDSKFPPVLAHEKFVDRNPEIKAAGNLTNCGESVADCLFISQIEPYGYVKRFLKPNIYPIGHSTQLPSRADDPCIGSILCNGISSYPSEPAVDLIYPPEISKLEFIQNEIAEKNAYPRRHRFINKLPDAKPCGCEKVLQPEPSVGELLHYPPEMMRFCNCDRHRIKINRHYNKHFNPQQNFGNDERIHFEDGRVMKNVLFESSLHEKFFPVHFAVEEFRQRNTRKLGETLEPNCDLGVALVDRGHAFGARRDLSEPIDDVLNIRGRENQRTRELLATIFKSISQSAFNQFDKFLSICVQFDKAQNGRILVEDLRCACKDTEMPITTVQFMNLLNWCGLITATNTVDYKQFCKIINPDQSFVPTDKKSFERGMDAAAKRLVTNEKPEKRENVIETAVNEQERPKFPRHETCQPIDLTEDNGQTPIDPLTKKIDDILTRVNTKKTTLQEINSNITDINMKAFRTFGHPLVRTDHPPPRTHRVGDLTNYGDDSDAYACLYPSIYTQIGISKCDMLKSRTKEEIFEVFTKVYPDLTKEHLSSLWQIAAKQTCDCSVSVEGIRQLLQNLHFN